MCTDVCTGMCTDVCTGMCTDMCTAMCIGMCTAMCTDMCTDLCAGMCTAMCTDLCTDMCTGMWYRDVGKDGIETWEHVVDRPVRPTDFRVVWRGSMRQAEELFVVVGRVGRCGWIWRYA